MLIWNRSITACRKLASTCPVSIVSLRLFPLPLPLPIARETAITNSLTSAGIWKKYTVSLKNRLDGPCRRRLLTQLALFQWERHEFLIEIAVVQLEGLAFQAVGLKAVRDEKQARLLAGQHNGKIDAFQPGQVLRVVDGRLQQRLADTLAAQFSGNIHAPDDALMSPFGPFLAPETGNAHQLPLLIERAKGHIFSRALAPAQPWRAARDPPFKNLLVRRAKRLRILLQRSQANLPERLRILLRQYPYIHSILSSICFVCDSLRG